MAFNFKFGKSSGEPVKPNDGLPKDSEHELTVEDLDQVLGYNPFPYGFPDESKNDGDELVVPKRGRR